MRLDLFLIRLAFIAFLVSLAVNLGWMLAGFDWRAIPCAIAGWYLADMTSGIVHMYMDYRPCRPNMGLDRLYFYAGSRESAEYLQLRDATLSRIGPIERLVYDFKNHHPRPDALGRRSMLRQVGSTVLSASLPFSLLLNLANWFAPVPAWAAALLIAFLIGGTFAQYFHGSLHRGDVPPIITLMRRTRLLMTPAAHDLHHQTLQRDFATNCGWSNPVLNTAFRALRSRGMLSDAGLEP